MLSARQTVEAFHLVFLRALAGGLRSAGLGAIIRTKLEFSRRGAIEGAVFGATAKDATRAYKLGPVLATHYDRAAAIAQKIHPLEGRAEPQARDVFDLAHLFATRTQQQRVIAELESLR